jgi:hypothetical protein
MPVYCLRLPLVQPPPLQQHLLQLLLPLRALLETQASLVLVAARADPGKSM